MPPSSWAALLLQILQHNAGQRFLYNIPEKRPKKKKKEKNEPLLDQVFIEQVMPHKDTAYAGFSSDGR